MNKFMKNKVGITLMAIGLLSMSVGVFRQEHKTVAKSLILYVLNALELVR